MPISSYIFTNSDAIDKVKLLFYVVSAIYFQNISVTSGEEVLLSLCWRSLLICKKYFTRTHRLLHTRTMIHLKRTKSSDVTREIMNLICGDVM